MDADFTEQPRAGGTFYVCEATQSSLLVRFARATMERILLESLSGMGRLARGRGVEVGGILLGVAERDGPRYSVRVEDFVTVPCEHAFGPSYVLSENDHQNLARTLLEWRRAPHQRLYTVGFWRSHTRNGLALRPEDLELLAAHFSHPYEIALLVQPHGAGPAQAAVFTWESGRIRADHSALLFEIDGPLGPAPAPRRAGARDSTPPPALAQEPETPVTGPPGEPSEPAALTQSFRFSMFETSPAPRPRAPRWLLAIVPVLALAVASYFAVQRGWLSLPQPNPPQDPFSIALRGAESAGHLHLTWDRSSPAVRAATRARLIITDGDQTRSLELTREQIHNGSVVYRPVTDRIEVRLELSLGRRTFTETWTYRHSPETTREQISR